MAGDLAKDIWARGYSLSKPTHRTNTIITEERWFIEGHEYKRKGRKKLQHQHPPLFLALVLADCRRITGFPLGRQ